MKKSMIFIAFALFSIPGFGQSPGVNDCRDAARNIIAYERPGSRNIVEVLKCSQSVTVLEIDQGYAEILISTHQRGFVEAQYVRVTAAKPTAAPTVSKPPASPQPPPAKPAPAKPAPAQTAPPPVKRVQEAPQPQVTQPPPAPQVTSPPPASLEESRPQASPTVPVYFEYPSNLGLSFGVKGGLNIANLSGGPEGATVGDNVNTPDYHYSEIESLNMVRVPAFNVGVFVEYRFNDVFGISPEIMYSRQGMKLEYIISEEESSSGYVEKLELKVESKGVLDYLNIPILAKIYATKALSIDVGPQFGFLLSAKGKRTMSGRYSETFPDGESFSNTVNIKDEFDIKNVVNTFDLGLGIGATYNIGKFMIQGRYNLGITDTSKFEGEKPPDHKPQRNNVFQIGVGYRF